MIVPKAEVLVRYSKRKNNGMKVLFSLPDYTLLKKVRGFPVLRRDVTYQTPPSRDNLTILGQGEFDK